jgi:hypothetical protein
MATEIPCHVSLQLSCYMLLQLLWLSLSWCFTSPLSMGNQMC